MSDTSGQSIETTFQQAEHTGLRLAIRGRFVAIAIVGVFFVFSRSLPVAMGYLAALTAIALLGVLHYQLIGSRWDRWWVKYLFVTFDFTLISWAVAAQPVLPAELPAAFVYRYNVFPYYFLILAVSAFSFSPGLVVWSGVMGCVGWTLAYLKIISEMDVSLNWTDIPVDATSEEYIAILLNPNFVPAGSRIQECLILLVVAILLALVMRRARQTVRAHIEADRDRRSISELFGQYVPAAVANALVAQRGLLEPQESQATVLFADIAGFTQLTESIGATRTVGVLNAYFDAMTEIIGRHNGVVTQFQGDAILATFNVPVADENHALNAVNAAREMLQTTDANTFDGVDISIRIGINTGPLVAGSVGGGGRRNYTVHGDCVNVAARLEALNKSFDTRLLLSHSVTEAVGEKLACRHVADAEVRGVSANVPVFTTTA